MNIDKAIEILSKDARVLTEGHPVKLDDAVQLGIEALRRCKRYRELHVGLHYTPMPGETED